MVGLQRQWLVRLLSTEAQQRDVFFSSFPSPGVVKWIVKWVCWMGRISIPSNQDPAENGDRPVFLLGGGRDPVAGWPGTLQFTRGIVSKYLEERRNRLFFLLISSFAPCRSSSSKNLSSSFIFLIIEPLRPQPQPRRECLEAEKKWKPCPFKDKKKWKHIRPGVFIVDVCSSCKGFCLGQSVYVLFSLLLLLARAVSGRLIMEVTFLILLARLARLDRIHLVAVGRALS